MTGQTRRRTREQKPPAARKPLTQAEQEQREKKAVMLRAEIPEARHKWLVVSIAERGGIQITNTHEDPLREYRRRRLIDDRQVEAGLKLAGEGAIYTSSGTIDFERVMCSAGGRNCLTERQLMALDNFLDAMEQVSGDVGKRLLLDVCCLGYTLRALPSVPYHRRSQDAFPRFLEALDELCYHYGSKRHYELHTINSGL